MQLNLKVIVKELIGTLSLNFDGSRIAGCFQSVSSVYPNFQSFNYEFILLHIHYVQS